MKRMITYSKIFSLTKSLEWKNYFALFVIFVICVICFKKTLVLSIIWSKCKNEDKKILKEEE